MEDGSWKIGVLPVLKPEKGKDRVVAGPVKICGKKYEQN